MNKKQLYIDTQFQQFNSTDIKENRQKSIEYQSKSSIIDPININFQLLDLYFQGLIKLTEFFDKRQPEAIIDAFNKIRSIIPPRSNRYNSDNPGNLQFRNHPRKKRKNDDRDMSESITRMRELGERANRLIENRRLKSETKHNNSSVIFQQQGKKILSKLDKLEKIIKDIRMQNQISNQASIVYASRSRHPDQIVYQDHMAMNRHRLPPQEEYIVRPTRYYSSMQSPHPADYYHAFSVPTDRYYVEPPNYNLSPTFPQYSRLAPSYIPYQSVFQQDRLASSTKRGNTPHRVRVLRQHYRQDEVQQNSEVSESIQQKQQVNTQLQQIKKQLDELKKMNKAYITNNTIMLDQAKNKQKIPAHPNQGKKNTKTDNIQQQYTRKGSNQLVQSRQVQRQNSTHTYPIIPELNLRENIAVDLRAAHVQNIRNDLFPDDQFQQPRYYTHRNNEQYRHTHKQQGNYYEQPIPQRVYTLQQYNTPLHERHRTRQLSSGVCGQCGCRCHDHQPHKQPVYVRGRYQAGM